jgi:hypothetical protein
MNTRRLPYILFFLLTLIPLALLSVVRITDFHGRRENNIVILEWSTIEESNIKQFNVERNTDINTENWVLIGSIEAIGESSVQQSYTFRDMNIFKTNLSNFYYRLAIVDKNNQTTYHDVIVSISVNSGIKHTWGSIKAMFR